MNKKEYKMPDGRTVLFMYDENGIGQITLEAMDSIMSMIKEKWIPCSERMPEEEKCYLVTSTGTHNDIIDIAYYSRDVWHKASRIKAWMPLPEPYKEVEE